MDKLSSLFKIAILKNAGWFGDARNFIRLLDSKGIKINRRGKFKTDSKFSKHIYTDDSVSKTISIPRGEKRPIHMLFHEGGHGLYTDKMELNKAFLVPGPLTKLKHERIANATALQHITDPKDRKAYIKIIKNNATTKNRNYGAYKRLVKNENFDKIWDKAKDIKFTKRPNDKFNIIKKELDEKNKMHIISAIKPSLNKKPWVR